MIITIVVTMIVVKSIEHHTGIDLSLQRMGSTLETIIWRQGGGLVETRACTRGRTYLSAAVCWPGLALPSGTSTVWDPCLGTQQGDSYAAEMEAPDSSAAVFFLVIAWQNTVI